MKKIYFIDTMIDDFIEYVKRFDNCKNYMSGSDLLQLAKYYAKSSKVYITDRGQTFYNGKEYASTPSRVTFLFDEDIKKYGQTVTDYNQIIAIESERFNNDRQEYIHDHLYNFVFCECERILRTNHNGNIDQWDSRILSAARKIK